MLIPPDNCMFWVIFAYLRCIIAKSIEFTKHQVPLVSSLRFKICGTRFIDNECISFIDFGRVLFRFDVFSCFCLFIFTLITDIRKVRLYFFQSLYTIVKYDTYHCLIRLKKLFTLIFETRQAPVIVVPHQSLLLFVSEFLNIRVRVSL